MSMLKQFIKNVGHTQQKIMQKYGGAEKTVDLEFEYMKEKYDKISKNLKEFELVLAKQKKGVLVAKRFREVNEFLVQFYTDELVSQYAQKYTKAVDQMDEAIKEFNQLHSKLETGLNTFIKNMAALKQKMEERQLALLDFDKLRGGKLEKNSKGQPDKKFEEQKANYEKINEQVKKDLREFLENRYVTFDSQYKLLISGQYELFQSIVKGFQDVASLLGTVPPTVEVGRTRSPSVEAFVATAETTSEIKSLDSSSSSDSVPETKSSEWKKITKGDTPRDSPETIPKIARERTFSMDEELKDDLSVGSFTSEKSDHQVVAVQEIKASGKEETDDLPEETVSENAENYQSEEWTYKIIKPIFGRPLHEVVNPTVPTLVVNAIEYLSLPKNITEEGILRMSGSKTFIDKLKADIDDGKDVDFTGCDPHAVSGVLKSFFRELPEPIVPRDLSERIGEILAQLSNPEIKANIDPEILLESVKGEVFEAMKELLEPNLETFGILVRFFSQVAQNSAKNRMTIGNIVTCFGPTLNINPGLISLCIEHIDYFFPLPN